MNYRSKEGLSTFAKVMIAVSLFFTAVIIAVVVAFGGPAETSNDTPRNFINNSMSFQKDGSLNTFPAVPIADYKPEEEKISESDTILTVFADYACPHCQDFETAVEGKIDEMLEDGTITELRIAPVSYQPTPYAQLGHLAILCIADAEPDKALQAHKTLMSVGGEGGTDFTTLMKRIGDDTGSELKTETKMCIKNSTFSPFAQLQNEEAQQPGFWPLTVEGITGTPAVFINEQRFSGQPDPELLGLAVNWVRAGGTLADLTKDPTLLDNLDLSDPKNPTIQKSEKTEPEKE